MCVLPRVGRAGRVVLVSVCPPPTAPSAAGRCASRDPVTTLLSVQVSPPRPPPLLPRPAVGPAPSSTPDPPLHSSSTFRLRVYARLAVVGGPGDVQDPGPGRSSGQSNVLFVSHIPAALLPVNGAWDEWSPWSLCSSTCGRGFRSRTRTCTPPQFGGEPCVGPEKQTKFCNIAVCPGGSLPCTLMHVSPVW